ncbi:cytochrome P450 [Dacryopinax primogenitus]|uniref:Cytochrome P450 n=1 Tax=Dacryopinax primogenitus (strain DJM 731) TaxID=1858805 RepID=M5FUQ8_DACPD|nr:cytochrome P450 [Dacryopinax primogenitus]EJT97006.1 cytochrome P450 [Dacryopinax primogenitus]
MTISIYALSIALIPYTTLLLPTNIPIPTSLIQPLIAFISFLLLSTILSHTYDILRRPANPQKYKIIRYRDLPGPRATSLIWGLEKDLYDDSPPGRLLERWSKEYGGAYRFRGVFGAKNITLTTPAALHHVLTTSVYLYPKPLGGRLWLGNLLGQGVLVSEGQVHARQRKQLARAFTPQALRGQHAIFERLAEGVVDAWKSLLARSPSSGEGGEGEGTTIDVQYWANRLSLDAIGLAGFGYSFGSLESAVEGTEQHPLARTFDKLTDSSGTYAAFVLRAVLFVWPGVLRIPSKRTRSIGEVRNSLGGEVKRVRREADQEGKTVIGILEQQAAAEGSGIADEEVEAQIMTLVFAGYETTSTAIAWALYELALHPSSQSELRAQLRLSPDYPLLLDAVIRETLRLHPPVLDLHRMAEQEDLVPLGEGKALWVERGTVVYVPLNVLSNEGREARWNPEQWLVPTEGKERERDIQWAFSDGPRVCIGRAFALGEIRTVVAALLREFEFAPEGEKEVEPFYSFVVRPRVRGERGSTLPLRVRRAA